MNLAVLKPAVSETRPMRCPCRPCSCLPDGSPGGHSTQGSRCSPWSKRQHRSWRLGDAQHNPN